MEIFKKLLVLIVTLFVTMLPFGFSFARNTNQTWHDLFGRGEALLLGVAFGADVLARSFIQTKDRPTRLIIGLFAGLICAVDLVFYGYATTVEATPGAIAPVAAISLWSLICLLASVLLEIAVILEEEL
jgi:hypothetical protein